MRQCTTRLLTGILSLVLAGCTAQRYMEAGDTAVALGDMRAAVYNYQRAMSHKASLADDPAFLSKLTTAESRVAYQEGLRLREAGEYEQAIRQLRIALDKDPGFHEAERLRLEVVDQASRWRYERGLAAADAGDLSAAREHLSHALRLSAGEGPQAAAMASLSPDSMSADTPGLRDYLEGVDHATSQRWPEARQSFEKAIAINLDLLPARAALHRANTALAQANHRMDVGRASLEHKRLRQAIGELQASLKVWPHNEQANQLLGRARQERAQAEAHFAATQQAINQGDWDKAIAEADAGLAMDVTYDELSALREELPVRAAAYYTDRGDRLHEEGKLDQAEASYHRAFDYMNGYRHALNGLAGVYHSRGEAQEAEGRLGAALLAYRRGQAFRDVPPLAESIARVTAAIQERVGMAIDLSVDRPGAAGLVGAEALGDTVLGGLGRQDAEGLAVNPGNAPYALVMTITGDDYARQRTATNRENHHYHTIELRDNPEYHRVRGALAEAQHKLDHAYKDYHHAVAQRDAARRHAEHLHHQIEQERLAQEQAERERQRQIEAAQREAREQERREREAREARDRERREREAREAARIAQQEREQREARDQARREREAREQARREREAQERRRQAQLEQQRREQAERERQQREQAERERQQRERAERERQRQQREREQKEQAERERQQQRERERKEREARERQRQRQKDTKTKAKATPHGSHHHEYERAKAKLHECERHCSACHRTVESHEAAVRKWKRVLANTPRHLEITHHHDWPFTVETHAVTGKLAVQTQLVDTRTGKVIEKLDQEAGFNQTDTVNLNPNPEIGLPNNPLELADERGVAGAMSREVAEASAPWAVNLAVQHRMAQIKERIDALRKAGKDEEALEAEVDLAVLLGAVDPEASKAMIDRLVERKEP